MSDNKKYCIYSKDRPGFSLWVGIDWRSSPASSDRAQYTQRIAVQFTTQRVAEPFTAQGVKIQPFHSITMLNIITGEE